MHEAQKRTVLAFYLMMSQLLIVEMEICLRFRTLKLILAGSCPELCACDANLFRNAHTEKTITSLPARFSKVHF